MRKRTARDLKDVGVKYQAIFENTGTAMVIIEEDMTLSLVNAEFERLSGYTKKEIEGKKGWTEFVVQEDIERMKGYHGSRRVDPRSAPGNYEFRFIDRNGDIKAIFLTTAMIPGTKKSVASLLDITDRKQAEQALRESEERLRVIFETAQDSIFIKDRTLKYTQVNPAMERLFGLPASKLIGRTDEELFGKEAGVHIREVDSRVIDGEIIEEEHTKPVKGFPTAFHVIKVPIQDTSGEIIGLCGIARDVTERRRAEEALRESEEKYRTLFEGSRDAIYITSQEGRLVDVNQSYLDLFGYTREELRELDVRETYVNPNDRLRFRQVIEQEGSVRDFELKLRKKDGTEMECLLTATVRRANDGSLLGYQGIIRDITEHKRAEELLQKERETFFSILNKAPYGVILMDKEGNYLYINPEFTSITGYTLEDVPTGRDWFHKAYPDQESRHNAIETWKTDLARKGVFDRVWSIVCKDGEVKEIEFRPTMLDDGRIIIMLSDITERKQAEEELAYIATHDTLTDLPNRMLFDDRLNLALVQAQRQKRKLAVMLLDLDYFKDINDTLGHSVGDKLLQAVGDRLTRLLRKGDTVARMGGDEFLLLLTEIARVEDATRIAQKVLEGFREPFVFDLHQLHITASIGVVIYPDDSEDAATLEKNADIAMYHAKEKGRNNYQRYAPTMNADTSD